MDALGAGYHSSMATFHDRLAALEHDIVHQGARVLDLCTLAVESYFDLDLAKAARIESLDTEVDRVDVEIRVMANSLIGMLRDTNRALLKHDADLARQVLLFDDTVDRFKREILMNAQEQVAAGHLSVHFAFGLMSVTKSVERIADHCTNVCEQVIYLESGLIVRHRPEGWSAPIEPKA